MPLLSENIWNRNQNTKTPGSHPGIRLRIGIDVQDILDSESESVYRVSKTRNQNRNRCSGYPRIGIGLQGIIDSESEPDSMFKISQTRNRIQNRKTWNREPLIVAMILQYPVYIQQLLFPLLGKSQMPKIIQQPIKVNLLNLSKDHT